MQGSPGPYLLGGCEAGQGAQVGGVGDEHGLQARVGVLGHLRLVAVKGWPGGRRQKRVQTWHPGQGWPPPRRASGLGALGKWV